MSYFGAVRAALAEGRHVVAPRFVRFDFDVPSAEPFRVWEGAGNITVDGETFQGMAGLGSISDAVFGVGDAAGHVTYQLSGVSPEVVYAAQSEASVIRGREVLLRGHFLDVATAQPLDDFFVIRNDIMDLLSYSGRGPSDRTVQLTAETIWTTRNAAAFAYYSDRDQQARFSGDLGMERIVQMKQKRVAWPLVGAF